MHKTALLDHFLDHFLVHFLVVFWPLFWPLFWVIFGGVFCQLYAYKCGGPPKRRSGEGVEKGVKKEVTFLGSKMTPKMGKKRVVFSIHEWFLITFNVKNRWWPRKRCFSSVPKSGFLTKYFPPEKNGGFRKKPEIRGSPKWPFFGSFSEGSFGPLLCLKMRKGTSKSGSDFGSFFGVPKKRPNRTLGNPSVHSTPPLRGTPLTPSFRNGWPSVEYGWLSVEYGWLSFEYG